MSIDFKDHGKKPYVVNICQFMMHCMIIMTD